VKKFECDRCHAQQELKKDGHSSAHIKIEPWRGIGATIEGLFAEMVATTAVLKGWDESDRRETVQDAWRQR